MIIVILQAAVDAAFVLVPSVLLLVLVAKLAWGGHHE